MSGVAAIRQLLHGWGALTALVPSTRIVSGLLPQGTELPAITTKLNRQHTQIYFLYAGREHCRRRHVTITRAS